MIRSVVKHSYTKGRSAKARCRAHINYISHRHGEDREQGGRKFFDRGRDDIEAREVKQVLYEKADERGVAMHRIILSPGLSTDAKEYTRELMEKLEQLKGQELAWRAVVHENTKHQHVHVVVMGLDIEGHRVRIDRDDHAKLREFGDEYLGREHKLERYLDRELEDLLKSREYERNWDEEFKRTIFGEGWQKSRQDDPDRARWEFEELDEKLRESLADKRSTELYPKPWEQRTIEQAGRLSEHHGYYTSAMAKERLERIALEHPELADRIQEELNDMKEIAAEERIYQQRDIELERVMSGDYARDRVVEEAETSFEMDRESNPESQDKDERQRDDQEGSWT